MSDLKVAARILHDIGKHKQAEEVEKAEAAIKEHEETLKVLKDLLNWSRRMPDACLSVDDPRLIWWYEGADCRNAAYAILIKQIGINDAQ